MKAQNNSVPNNERLAEVYRTAAQIILRKGYDATSINDIANALGMTKAGLYHYINFITEGALKAEILVSLRSQVRAIATSGVSCSHAEIIEVARTYNALIAFDSDHKTNPSVSRQLARLIAAREQDATSRNLSTTTRIVFWEGHKGIDDAAKANVIFTTISIPEWFSTLAGRTAGNSQESLERDWLPPPII